MYMNMMEINKHNIIVVLVLIQAMVISCLDVYIFINKI